MGCCESVYSCARDVCNLTNGTPNRNNRNESYNSDELLLQKVNANNIYNKFNIKDHKKKWKIGDNIISSSKHSMILLAEIRTDISNTYVAKITQRNNEIECYNKINHPSVIKMYDYYYNEFGQILFVEYIPNNDLFDYISNVNLDDMQILSIFKQIANCIQYLHSIGIAHRDMKLENILYTINYTDQIQSDIRIKLCDFDLSTIDEENSIDLCGTLTYYSPEMIKQKEYNLYSNDIWCLGIILYVLKYKQYPFEIQKILDKQASFDLESRITEEDKESTIGKLIKMILKPESERINIKDLCKILRNDDN